MPMKQFQHIRVTTFEEPLRTYERKSIFPVLTQMYTYLVAVKKTVDIKFSAHDAFLE
jgi:hypothetical protein